MAQKELPVERKMRLDRHLWKSMEAYDGLFATVTAGAPADQLREMCSLSPVLMERVTPNIVHENVKKFESSYVNFVRTVNVLHKDGLVTKAKYNSIRSSLSMTSNEENTGKSHVKFTKSWLIPKLMSYKQLKASVNAINSLAYQGHIYAIHLVTSSKQTLHNECRCESKITPLSPVAEKGLVLII